MQTLSPLERNQKIQNIYFYVSIGMIVLSLILFGLGIVFTQTTTPAPDAVINFAVIYMQYHYLHVVIGIGLLIYYTIQKKRYVFKMKIIKTILGLIFSPFSYMIIITAILLLGLSSCAS